MFKNYLKIAWRDLLRNRRLSIINILGLSLSIAFCLLLFFYISYERSYDRFHQKKDRLFRIEMTSMWPSDKKPEKHLFGFLSPEEEVKNQLIFPLVVGRDMQQAFPDVKRVVRYQQQSNVLVRAGKDIFQEEHMLYADPAFFSSFSFPAQTGNVATALNSLQNCVITESTAKKYFGREDPIGKTLRLVTDSSLFTVAAVAKDPPANSSIRFGLVVPLEADADYKENISSGFNHSSHLLVVELAENTSPEQFSAKMNKWVKSYFLAPYLAENGKYHKGEDFSQYRWYLRPFADSHYNASGPWGHFTDANNIYQLSCLVVIILLIACLNYVLLMISNAAARSQEVGVRKVMGARKIYIILQFWVQTQVVVVLSVLVALVLSRLLLPLFNGMIGTELRFENLAWGRILTALLALCLLLGLCAGFYPALLLSRMKTVSIIKSFQTFRVNPRFSKVLVVLQYTGCVVLMIAAFVINRQMEFIRTKNLGFDKEQVLMVKNPTWDYGFTKHMREALRNYSASQPNILTFSGMNGGLDGSYNTNGFLFNGEQKWRKELTVDYNYFEMLGIRFLQGRPFSPSFSSDTARKVHSIVVNETLFRMLGDSAKLGEYCTPLRGTIIGIVQDYHFETLSNKIEPQEHRLTSGYVMYFMFKLKAGQIRPGIAGVEQAWKSLTDLPFEYSFLDDTLTKMYEADLRWQKTIQASCFFAIFIACMGLFGLSAINAINRTKEIGIRKVLGAGVKDIVATLSSSFLLMIFFAILIATPIAWWVMNRWLEDFAYRITISWWMFAGTGLAALLIALATVSFQAIKAAVANPIKALRSE